MHEQLDLAALDEVRRLISIAGSLNVGVSGNFNGARILRLALQRIAQLLFELVGFMHYPHHCVAGLKSTAKRNHTDKRCVEF